MMNLGDQIQGTMGAHGLWKTRLSVAIESGASEFSVAVVKQDGQCAFGKWLRGDGVGAQMKQSPEYVMCADLHRRFHLVTADVLSLALQGRKADALNAIETNSEFARASAALTLHLMKWRVSSGSLAAWRNRVNWP
jgi:methyl-accepting chemotaxis protein